MVKYSIEDRLAIGKRIYDHELSKCEASWEYKIGVYTAGECMRLYRKTFHLPVSFSKASPRKQIPYKPVKATIREVKPGDVFGHVRVIAPAGKYRNRINQYLVECECGRRVVMMKGNLFHSNDFYCRSCATAHANEKRRVILTGETINGWEVLREMPMRNKIHVYECRCLRCGKISVKNAGQITRSKTDRCLNCGPQYGFVIKGNSAAGTLPDGTKFLIDAEDVERVNQHMWHVEKDGYIISEIDGHSVRLHRFILGESNPKVLIDHANRNIHDNRKENLRIADCIQNSANHGLFITNKTGYTGVYFSNSSQQYECKVGWQKKRILLGKSINDLVLLGQMYNIAATYLYGEFAGALNDVPTPSRSLVEEIESKLKKYRAESALADSVFSMAV